MLVISASLWPIAGRISIALSKAGFCVGALSRTDSVIRKVKAIHAHFILKPWARKRSIVSAINAFAPDLLVCTDDDVVSDLHRIYQDVSKLAEPNSALRVARLIEASLGNPETFPIAREKSRLIEFAGALGVRCPRTIVVSDETALDHEIEKLQFPVVLKADGTCGGAGVRLVYERAEARKAFRELSMPGWLGVMVQSFDELTYQPLLDGIRRRRRIVTLQEYISGRPANRALLCSRGTVLAGLSVEVHQTQHSTGPSTVSGIIHNREMQVAAETLVRGLGLTGYHGFDFVIDGTNQAWLLELNSRVTSMSHLSVGEFNPAAMLFSYISKNEIAPAAESPLMDKLIAQFPQEWQRCPDSDYLRSCFHDAPWDEPEFARACLSSQAQTSRTARFRQRVARMIGFGKPKAADSAQKYWLLFNLSRDAAQGGQTGRTDLNQNSVGEISTHRASGAKPQLIA